MKSIKEILEPFILDKDGVKINHLYSHNAEYLIKQLEDNQREFGKKLLDKAADNVNVDIDEFGNITGYDNKMKESILNTLDNYLLNNKI
jgi:hypothetical protein